jgi:hypothetical protein
MNIHRSLAVGIACLGFGSVLSGCGDYGPVCCTAERGAEPACEQRVQWPEWPGALPSTLTPDERALFRRAWSSGPNFACDALLVTRGCGTGCVSGLIYDAGTQRTLVLPFAIHRDPAQDEPPLAFRQNSPIIVANGWRDEIEQGVFRYGWDGERLRPLGE